MYYDDIDNYVHQLYREVEEVVRAGGDISIIDDRNWRKEHISTIVSRMEGDPAISRELGKTPGTGRVANDFGDAINRNRKEISRMSKQVSSSYGRPIPGAKVKSSGIGAENAFACCLFAGIVSIVFLFLSITYIVVNFQKIIELVAI